MIGIVVITHGNFGEGILESTKHIMKSEGNCLAINLTGRRDLNELREQIKTRLSEIDTTEGVLFLIDAMGGSPYNAVLPLLADARMEVVTGVNLPMLMSAFTNRPRLNVKDLARKVVDDGRKTMIVASPRAGKTPTAS
jgi:PTS system mannose-specific IIA component